MDVVIQIAVSGESGAESNRMAGELAQLLKKQGIAEVRRVKDDPTSMDAGTVLIAILAAPAIVELAKGPAIELSRGIADWLRKRRATVSIGPEGKVLIEHVRPEDVERVVLSVIEAQRRS
jgi:hypothetical protein